MAFCQHCGQQLAEGAAFCAHCGAPAEAAQQAPQQPAAQQPEYQQPQQPAPPTVTVMNDPDAEQNKGIAWLAYFGIFFLIPMFVRKDSEYCRYHVKQGATLFALELAYTLVTQLLLAIIGAIFPGHWYFYVWVPSGVYTAFNVIFSLGSIFFLVLAIMGIVYAATCKKQELPLINKIPWIANLLDKFYQKK